MKGILRKLLHGFGLSCLSGAVFGEIMVFYGIVAHGNFIIVEPNLTILGFEFVLTVFTICYLVYLYCEYVKRLNV